MARLQSVLIGIGVGMYVSVGVSGLAWAQMPAGTAFSYQGRLTDDGAPASGVYDLRFTLFDAETGTGTIGTPVVADDVTVASGLFAVMLDFGATAFTGDARWLEIAVRPGASTDAFTPLASRQVLTPAPHAIFSQSSATSQHSVTSDTATNAANATIATNSQHSVTSDTATNATNATNAVNSQHSTTSDSSVTSQSADAAPWNGITGKPAGFADDVDNDTLTTLSCSTAGQVAKWTGSAWACAADGDAAGLDWKLTGNAGTGGAAALGTTDNQPFTLIANGTAVLRIVPYITNDRPALIGGSSANTGGVHAGATIAGGGEPGNPNVITGSFGTIGGGLMNASGDMATVGGGTANTASGSAATVGGGYINIASGFRATVPGGEYNRAAGDYSFAAGKNAVAGHNGSFVWGDDSPDIYQVSSTGPNQFIVRAAGGIWFGATYSPPDLSTGFINTSTGAYLSNGGTWTNASDRNLKEGFAPIDGARLLDQLARLPITSWSYKSDPGARHIGPMAQDFQTIFGVGDSDKAISTIDPAGIALATIQELHRRLDAQTATLAAQAAEHAAAIAAARAHATAQDAQIAALQAIVRELQQTVSSRSTAGGR
jgi:hypothetical protein